MISEKDNKQWKLWFSLFLWQLILTSCLWLRVRIGFWYTMWTGFSLKTHQENTLSNGRNGRNKTQRTKLLWFITSNFNILNENIYLLRIILYYIPINVISLDTVDFTECDPMLRITTLWFSESVSPLSETDDVSTQFFSLQRHEELWRCSYHTVQNMYHVIYLFQNKAYKSYS